MTMTLGGAGAAVSSVMERARSGDTGVVIIQGDAGSGKSRLLDDAAGAAVGFRVLRAGGVETESALPYGALQQLCGPLGDAIEHLPAPQASALGIAFGVLAGLAPDPFLVGVGLVSLLTASAAAQPLVCLIDDVHWVDASSARALGFAARRLGGSGVAFVMAVADPVRVPELAGLPHVRLDPLAPDDAARLLAEEMPGRLEPRVLRRILAEARGNPCVIRELGRSTTVEQLAGGFAMGSEPRDAEVLERFAARCTDLSADVATALLLAATEPFGDPVLLQKALDASGLRADALRDAEATGLLRVRDQVVFCHPAARLAIYDTASDPERREVHRLLGAAARAGNASEEQAVWHEARAGVDANEEIAATLERAAERVIEAAGLAAAAAFLEQSAALSEDRRARIGRLLAAARTKRRIAAFGAALRLVAAAEREELTDTDAATAEGIRAEIVRLTDPHPLRETSPDAPDATRSAMRLWDADAAEILTERGVEHARRTGALADLPGNLDLRACLHVVRGELDTAAAVAEEAAALAARIGAVPPCLAKMHLRGWQCDETGTVDLLERRTIEAAHRGDTVAMTFLEYCTAIVNNGLGRYDQALYAGRCAMARPDSFVSMWAAAEVVEAAVRAGQPEVAVDASALIASVSRASGTDWALGIARRGAALTGGADSVEDNFRASIRHLERAGMIPDLARTRLLFGEWLRRQKRRVDARAELRAALAGYEAIGANSFARRASLELRATGELVRRRAPELMHVLTERESQVVELARDGLSNPEIGTRLFISARTVEYHLHKVFSKLGIVSRAQLRTAVAPAGLSDSCRGDLVRS